MIGQTISHYKILEKLGGGGMGVVYKAEDTKLKRTVALKFLPPDLTRDDEAKERFVHEAQAASALDHPNICTIHEIGETEDGQLFICMAYYEGETLKKKVTSNQLSVTSAIDISVQIAQGLTKAHEKGIVHRDIKPANLFVTNDGILKILDFGLAKLAGVTKLTKPGTTLGTVAYMSPEQMQGEEVDQRTDIWALGVVIYEMLTGKLPFKGEYEQAVMYSILNEKPEPITATRSDVPTDLERVVNKCLEKKTPERYQHIDELLIDLKSLKEGVVPGIVKKWLIIARLARRKRAYLYGGIVGLLILFLVAGLYFFTGRAKAIDSAAVLPFVNVSGDPNTEYLGDGITESLINGLSQLSNLKVMSRSAVFRYKGSEDVQKVGRDLGVRAVLTGRIVQRGDDLAISVALVNAQDNSHIWGERYNRKLADLLAIQEEIAREISEKLRLRLSGEEQKRLAKRYTENSDAYQAYLTGRYHLNKYDNEGVQKGIEHFKKAIAIDPNYALAYAGIAEAYCWATGAYLSPMEAMPKAKEAAMKALEIDDAIVEAHTSLGMVRLWYEWDWVGAEIAFKRAIALNPGYAPAHNWYAEYLVDMGRFDEGLTELKRAQQLDPVALNINAQSAWALYMARRYDQALAAFKKILDMDPNYASAHFWLGQAFVQKQMHEEAIAEFQKARSLDDSPVSLALLGHAYAASGKRSEALKVLDELNELSGKGSYVSPYWMAALYTTLGEKDQALNALHKEYEDRNATLPYLKIDPLFDGLRAEPRFIALLKKVGLEND
jgi:serine/threonine-protein kinase